MGRQIQNLTLPVAAILDDNYMVKVTVDCNISLMLYS